MGLEHLLSWQLLRQHGGAWGLRRGSGVPQEPGRSGLSSVRSHQEEKKTQGSCVGHPLPLGRSAPEASPELLQQRSPQGGSPPKTPRQGRGRDRAPGGDGERSTGSVGLAERVALPSWWGGCPLRFTPMVRFWGTGTLEQPQNPPKP